MQCSECGELKLRKLRICPSCMAAYIMIVLGQIIGVSVGVVFVADRGDVKEIILYAIIGNTAGALTGGAIWLFASFFSGRARR